MNHRKASHARMSNNNAWTQLAYGSDGQPPGGVGKVAVAIPPRDPTLTEKFNAAVKKPVLYDAAKGPVYRQLINILQRQRSQPKHTLEMTPMGSVTRGINPNKDRSISAAIDYITARLDRYNGLTKHFARAVNKGYAKAQFNRASQGVCK